MVFCDTNPDVLEWSSEEIVIGYISPADNKQHRYFPDFFMKVKDQSGNEKKFLIEVKPYSQCFPPKGKNKTKRFITEMQTYAVNQAKWKAAKYWCDQRGIEFKVMTEKELQPKK